MVYPANLACGKVRYSKHTQGGQNNFRNGFQYIDHNSHTNMNLSKKCETICAQIKVLSRASNMLSSAKDTLSRRASCVSRMSLSCTAFSWQPKHREAANTFCTRPRLFKKQDLFFEQAASITSTKFRSNGRLQQRQFNCNALEQRWG